MVVHSSVNAPINEAMIKAMASQGITLRGVSRTQMNRDWCQAEVKSEWFMYTNSYHRLRSSIDVMVTDDGRPLIPFIYADTPYCSEYPACSAAMERARVFDPDADKHIQVRSITKHDLILIYSLHLTPFGSQAAYQYVNPWSGTTIQRYGYQNPFGTTVYRSSGYTPYYGGFSRGSYYPGFGASPLAGSYYRYRW